VQLSNHSLSVLLIDIVSLWLQSGRVVRDSFTVVAMRVESKVSISEHLLELFQVHLLSVIAADRGPEPLTSQTT